LAAQKYSTEAERRKARSLASSKWQKANLQKHAASNGAFRRRILEQVAGRPKPTRCDICKKSNLQIHFDHCHKKGHFRGWLCFACNAALGAARDSPKILRRLAEYLENDKTRDTRGLPKLPKYLIERKVKDGKL
jgi:hypothetical protein